EYEEAARTLEGAARHIENDAELFHELIRAYEAMGRHGDIEAAVRRGLRADPEHPALLAVHGRMLAARGQHAEAAEAFERAKAGDKELVDAWLGAGRAYRQLGRT